MAELDMSDVLSDPDFQDTFSVTQTIRSLATGTPVDTKVSSGPLTGPVTPAPFMLARRDDGSMMNGSITIYTQTQMTVGYAIDGLTSRLADTVAWHGSQYQVRVCEDWSAYGPGFWRIVADLLTINPTS